MAIRYFKIAGITISYEVDLDWERIQLNPALLPFMVDGSGEDNFVLQRSFVIPKTSAYDLGKRVHNNPPWLVYENTLSGRVYYMGTLPDSQEQPLWTFADFPTDYSEGKVYSHPNQREYCYQVGLQNLSGFPSDSIWLAPLLANRNGVMMHSSAVCLNGKGLVFIGRSEAGKTTTYRMFKQTRDRQSTDVTPLCDETNIIRRLQSGWQVSGTWGHGDESEVSAASSPLKGIFVLKQKPTNSITKINDRTTAIQYLLLTLFRPFMSATWWAKTLEMIDLLVKEIPIYEMSFDKSGGIIQILDAYTRE